MPLPPVFNARDMCGPYLRLVFGLVDIGIVLSLQVNLVVRDDLVVRQAHLCVDEVLVAVHEERGEVKGTKCLSRPEHLVLL